jgi:hypothetical protein
VSARVGVRESTVSQRKVPAIMAEFYTGSRDSLLSF